MKQATIKLIVNSIEAVRTQHPEGITPYHALPTMNDKDVTMNQVLST